MRRPLLYVSKSLAFSTDHTSAEGATSGSTRRIGGGAGNGEGADNAVLAFRMPVVLLFFASTFAYVGAEQGTANWMSQFLATYHHRDPQTTGALAVSWFWGLMTVGCVIGVMLLRWFDSRKVLIGGSCLTLVMLTL